jgi:DNA-directed RNA polymerase subunit RPC12/RpoP
MADYVTCPTCGSKVLTADAFIGRQVRCFGCGSRFVASADPTQAEAPKNSAKGSGRRHPDDEYRRPPPRISHTDDDEEEWPFCPGCGRQVSWTDEACRHCGEEFEEEDAPLRSVLRTDVVLPLRRDGEAHRGGLLLTLGSVSCVTGLMSACSFGLLAIISVPLGAVVMVLASRDLKRMQDGSVDAGGRPSTERARATGIAGVVLGVLFAGVYLLIKLAQ